ncbi:hypothetical protein JHW43_002899 [Diplocarpon mali]|nr:hypothetical protein JHW43_002899 [Diplocarpon mali]
MVKPRSFLAAYQGPFAAYSLVDERRCGQAPSPSRLGGNALSTNDTGLFAGLGRVPGPPGRDASAGDGWEIYDGWRAPIRQKPSRRGGLCTQQLPPSRQTLQITTSPAATRTHGPAQDEDPTPTAIPRGASFQNITPRDASPSSQEGSPPRRPCWPPDGEQSVPLVRVPRAME